MDKYNILIQIPQHRTGVYVIYNPVQKKAYVGEGDVCARLANYLSAICLNEDGSNKNLMEEEKKSFVMLSVIKANYNKDKTDPQGYDKNQSWLKHETIVMYVLRKRGITLYNGNEYGRDNAKRKFLLEPDTNISVDELKTKTLEYLGNEYSQEKWDELFKKVEDELIESLFKPIDSADQIELEDYWKEVIKKSRKDGVKWEIIRNDRECRMVRNKLTKKMLTKHDMETIGIKPIEKEKLEKYISNGDFDRVIFHKFGKYIGQTFPTIFGLKLNDMKNVNLGNFEEKGLEINQERSGQGVCLWALRNFKVEDARKFLAKNKNDKKPRYMIMIYTPSKKYSHSDHLYDEINPRPEESIEEFSERFKNDENIKKLHFPVGYTKEGKYKKKYQPDKVLEIPIGMTPPYINKEGKRSVAFIVSDFRYIDVNYDIKDLEKHFISDTRNELVKAINHSQSTINAELSESREELKKYIHNNGKQNEESDFVSFLVARLEYPYIITLVNEIG